MSKRVIGHLIVCAAFVTFSAQTPAPAQPPAAPPAAGAAPVLPDKPLRHLEYTFAVDYQGLGEDHQSDIGGGGSGVSDTSGAAGRQGTLDVDVLAVAKDGGMVVRMAEWLQNQPKPKQSYICAVYSEGRVVCPENLPVTDVENELMTFLGISFIDPAIVDDNGHWVRNFANKYVSVASDFTIVGAADANPLTIQENTKITSVGGVSTNWDDTAKITYDRPLSVPVSIHDLAVQKARGASSVSTTMDFHLTKDSFAH
jgi:hypothetical protein